MAHECLQFREGKGIATAQAEAGDALAEVTVEGGVGVDEGLGGVLLGVTDEGGEFGPFLVFEAHVDFLLMFQKMAGDEFFVAGVHGSITVR
jgi:hypothetical protein